MQRGLYMQRDLSMQKRRVLENFSWERIFPESSLNVRNAGRRTVFLGPWFWLDFQNARNFQNTNVSFTCTVERSHKSCTSIFSQPKFLSLREILVDKIWTALFEKEPWKVKPPLKAPKKSRDFWNFLGFVELQMSWTHHARILQLLQHYLKTFLNFENSLRYANIFKTTAR